MTKYNKLVNYIKENQDKFYRVAYSYTKSKEDSLDIVQEAIYKALKSSRQIKEEKYMSTWFYRILINTSNSYLKSNKSTLNIDLLEEPISETKNDDEIIDLYDAIDSLTSDDKSLVILRYFEDLKFKDIAEITNSNINTVKTRTYQILDKLKLKLEFKED